MTPNRTTFSLSLAAAMLVFSTGTAFAQDDRQQARAQRGIAGALPNGNQGRAVEPALPLEPPITLPDTLPVAATGQVAPDRTQSPSLPPDLGALPPDVIEMPSMPELGEPSQSNQLPSLPALGEPSQTDQFVTITQEPGAEKKPGFFKRMWTKVKGFVSGVKNKVTTAIAKNRAKRAERKALEASSQNSQSAQVFDADIYQGGGDGGSSGAAE